MVFKFIILVPVQLNIIYKFFHFLQCINTNARIDDAKNNVDLPQTFVHLRNYYCFEVQI
jgi:hypothetical protein